MKTLELLAPIKQISRNTRALFTFAWAMDRRIVIFYYLTSAFGSIVPLASSYVLKLLIDNLQNVQHSLQPTIPVVILAVLASRYIVSFADGIIFWGFHQSYLDYLFRYKLQNAISLKFHEKIANLDIAHFEDPNVQDLIAKSRDTMLWRLPDFMRILADMVSDIVAFFIAFVVLIPYGWWIPLIVTLITIPRLYFQARYGAIQWSFWGSGAPQVKKLWYLNYLLQEPTTVREMKISQSASSLLEKFKDIQEYLFGLNKKALDTYLRVLTIPPFIEGIFIFLIAYHFVPGVISGTLTIGSFTLLVTMLEQLGWRAANASAHSARLYENNFYVNHYFEILSLPALIPIPEKPLPLGELKPPNIEFRNVTFSYPGSSVKALERVSFTIEAGESVAFVGHNGAGKTTIVKLLCRFYDADEGEVLINGHNIKKLDPAEWYKFLGTLFQEFVRYHFTVRENITLGAPEKNDESAMHDAAIKSGAAEFIEKFPKKYDQILGKEFEDGEELSGGQWQKIAIARAFYEEPPVLILDEPTSAIDAEAEYEIFNNLERQYKNKTLILVSHRFSTVRNANNIIVVEHGKIVENGSHDELMRLSGHYAKLFSIQAKGYQ